ncbi:MAG: thioredoxin domain-containing protein [Bacteriovoracaceae bacterium]
MQEKKSLTQNGLNLSHTFLILIALTMIGTCIYLTKHYFDLHFATADLTESSSLCNINSFFTCDSATLSKMSNIAGVPIAFFGMMLGVSFLLGSIFPSETFERTNKGLAIANGIGCALLFIFSLAVLKTLCPFCTFYYVLSWLSLFLFIRFGIQGSLIPDIKIISLLGVITLVGAFLFYNKSKELTVKKNALSNSVIDQFYKLPNLGLPAIESPFTLAKAADFGKAPLNVMIYSDFQCPYCKLVHEIWNKLAQHYAGKINIHYYFYPLDMNCNAKMTRPMHQFACQASYIAACSPNFKEAHDDLFKNQDNLSNAWLDEKIKSLKIEACVKDPATKEKVVQVLTTGEKFNIQSTPTIILNGVKIEGSLPEAQFIGLMDEIVRRHH